VPKTNYDFTLRPSPDVNSTVPTNRPTALLSSSVLLLILCGLLAVLMTGCTQRGASRTLQQTLRTNTIGNRNPVVLAAYQPWFGRPGHISVGYSSQDRTVLQKQIDKARELGISAFIVNWYGPSRDFEDHSYAALQSVAAATNFKVALMYDESVDDPASATEQAITDLQYAYQHYIGPQASGADAYLTMNDRPMIFIFPKSGDTDWGRVKQALNSWAAPPLFIYKDSSDKYATVMDGFYAWVNPGRPGWQSDGSEWGRDYLADFYQTMRTKYPDKIAIGAAWPGFNDSRASWSRNRKMDYRCGRTMEDSMRMYHSFYDEAHPLPFLMIDTWNDYEEGTAIENGLPTCNGPRQTNSASESGLPGHPGQN